MADSLRPFGLYSPWNSPGQNIGVGSLSLLQEIFQTQGSNPGLLYCKWIFLPAEPQGKPKNIGVGSLSLLQLIFLTQESKSGLLIVDSLPTELSGMPTFQNLRLSPFSLVIPNPFQCFSAGYQCFKFKLKISRHLFNRIILGNIQ